MDWLSSILDADFEPSMPLRITREHESYFLQFFVLVLVLVVVLGFYSRTSTRATTRTILMGAIK